MAVAVNVTLVPIHIAPLGFAVMLTLAGNIGFTVIVMEFEVAGDPDTQVRDDVITQVITFPLASVVEVYVEFVAPEIVEPLFCH